MHILITGACGFVGRALMQRLLDDPCALPQPLTLLTGIDHSVDTAPKDWLTDHRVQLLAGDFADPVLLLQALRHPPDWVFHLASVPGSLAEKEQALGLQVNLLSCITLFLAVAASALDNGRAARVVFTSSVAVYGNLPADSRVNESCAVRPMLTYGAHKLMLETLLTDMSRRGVLDGISLRLPGIVARPATPTGHGSAFMSALIRRLGNGLDYECPVSREAQAWWMSLPCCIDNLLHAAALPAAQMPESRTVQLPVITATVGALIQAIAAVTGLTPNVSHVPDAGIERLFGRQPPLDTPLARQLGFTDDGDMAQLVVRTL